MRQHVRSSSVLGIRKRHCKYIELNIRLFADFVIYREILAKEDITKLQRDVVRLGE